MAKSIARFLADVASTTGVLDGTLSTAAQPNITSVGTLSSLTISGNLNATLTTAAQTNITSLGTLSSLNLSGALSGTTATFTTADNLTQVRLISTDADANIGPRLDLFRNSASPAAGDFIGRVRFLGEDSAGNETAYVHFDSLIVDPTDGSEDGQLRIETKVDGSMIERITMNSTETVINDNHANLDFRVESDTKANAFFIEGTTGIVGINTNTPTSSLDVNGSSGIYSRHSTGGSLVLDDVDTADGSTPMVYMRNTAGTLRLGYANRNSSTGLTTGSTNTVQIAPTGIVDFTNHIDLPDNKYVRLGDNNDMLVYHNGSASYVQSATADLDIIFRGNDSDGGGGVDALTLDMSAGGLAKFSSGARPVTDGVGTLGGTSHRWGGLNIKSTTHEGVKFTIQNTVGNTSMQGFRLDMDVSGNETLTANRAMYGQYITLDSSSTGGSTTNGTEHRLYGIRSTVKATGDSDLIYGGYFSGEAEHSAGTVSALYGSYSSGSADPESGGTVSALYGAWNTATVYGSAGSTVNHAYASYNRLLLGTTDVVGHTNLIGVMSEIETDPSGTARVTTNGYLFRGTYDDDSAGEHKFTNFYGLKIDGQSLAGRTELETDNEEPRFGLPTGSTAGVYLDIPMESDYNCQGFWNSEDQPNYFRGSLGIGSGARQVGNTVGAELHLVEPDGGEAVLVRYDGSTQNGNSLGKIFWGSTEDNGVNVNFSASIEIIAGQNHSTSASAGIMTFKTTDLNSTQLVEHMRIDHTGNVGIGDNTPSFTNAALHVAKDMGNSVTAVARLRGRNSTARTTRLQFEDYSGAIADGLIDFVFPNAGSTSGAYLGMGFNAGNQLAINSSGYVGIGTTTPSTKLEVYDGSITLHAPSSTGNAWTYYKNSDRTYLVGIRGSLSDVLSFYDLTADVQRMQINTSGSIGAPTGTNIYNASDERLKQNISSLDNSLETIKNLNPVKFNWIDNFVEEENGKTLYGFVAQEVQDVFPDAIEPFADGKEIIVEDKVIGNPLTVREKFLVPMLVKAMQEQQTQIEALQAEVAALKGS